MDHRESTMPVVDESIADVLRSACGARTHAEGASGDTGTFVTLAIWGFTRSKRADDEGARRDERQAG